MDKRIQLGRLGEQAALSYLVTQGYRILEQNWRCRAGELDLIAEIGTTLVFIEVRTRSSYSFGTPFESVDYRKQQKVRKLAQIYLNYGSTLADQDLRFDVISVQLDASGRPAIDHLSGAF